jgi:hypothetical protein
MQMTSTVPDVVPVEVPLKIEPGATSPTIGIVTTTGSVAWSVPGYFLCGGGLQFLTADLVCHYTGTARLQGQKESMTGVRLTLEGINPVSGAAVWTQRVLDAQAMTAGTNIAFTDGSHLVVRLPSGKRVVLDVQDGKFSSPAHDESFWCEQVLNFKVQTATGASADGERTSEPVFKACSASGQSVDRLPTTEPTTVGVTSDGKFIWPTPDGLQAAPLPVAT